MVNSGRLIGLTRLTTCGGFVVVLRWLCGDFVVVVWPALVDVIVYWSFCGLLQLVQLQNGFLDGFASIQSVFWVQ